MAFAASPAPSPLTRKWMVPLITSPQVTPPWQLLLGRPRSTLTPLPYSCFRASPSQISNFYSKSVCRCLFGGSQHEIGCAAEKRHTSLLPTILSGTWSQGHTEQGGLGHTGSTHSGEPSAEELLLLLRLRGLFRSLQGQDSGAGYVEVESFDTSVLIQMNQNEPKSNVIVQ